MGVSTVHVLHGIQTPSSFYSQVDEATPSPAIEAMLGTPAGHFEPLFRGIRGLKPEVTFRTSQLATLLTECGITGVDLTAGNADLYYKKVLEHGTREADASSVHTRLRMADALMYWRSISARSEGESTAEVTLCANYDGTNAPIVPAGTLALSGTPTAAEYFGLGPVAINGSAIAGLTDATIDLGIEVRRLGSASEGFPTFAAVFTLNPTITLRGLSLEAWTSYGLVGAALSSLTLYLRKLNNDAAGGVPYVANATGAHIKFTAANGLCAVENSQGGGSSEVTTGLKLHLRSPNATTRSLLVAVNQAIT